MCVALGPKSPPIDRATLAFVHCVRVSIANQIDADIKAPRAGLLASFNEERELKP